MELKDWLSIAMAAIANIIAAIGLWQKRDPPKRKKKKR